MRLKRNFRRAVNLVASIAIFPYAVAQGTSNYHIGFNEPPNAPDPGSGIYVQSYGEDGVRFLPLPGSQGFVRFGGGHELAPDNGTPYIQATLGDSLRVDFVDGSSFSLISLELALYSSRVPPQRVQFVSYRKDGSLVFAEAEVDSLAFRTIIFSSEFSNLTHIDIPTYEWSLDNLIIQVPEPRTRTQISRNKRRP